MESQYIVKLKLHLSFFMQKNANIYFKRMEYPLASQGPSDVKANKTIEFIAIKWGIKKCAEVLQNWRYSGRGRRALAVSFPVPF